MTANNLNLVFVNFKAYNKFGQIMCICSEDIERKWNSDINQGPYLCYKYPKMTGNIPNQDLVNTNANIKFGKIMSNRS